MPGSKKTILIRIICFFWIIQKIICWKLWLADRIFPVVPVTDLLFVPSFVHLVLFMFSLAFFLLLFIYPSKRIIQVSLLVVELLSCLLDQNRWQPWEYQYFFMLLVFVINRKEKDIIACLGFIIAAFYFYSGIHKLNLNFLHTVWSKMILTKALHVDHRIIFNSLIYHAGYLVGLTEIALSIGLFFKRSKKIACILLIIMHVIILLALGPLGLNFDSVIWPWNIAMIMFIYILIFKNNEFDISLQSLFGGANILIVLLFGVLPVLSLFGYWDTFFSANLFSGDTPNMFICIKKATLNKELQPFVMQDKTMVICDSNSYLIHVRSWAFKEMHEEENPEIRIYKSIKQQFEKRYPGMQATFIIYQYINGKKTEKELQ